MKTSSKIIWKSKIFPDMVFTEQMLAVYKTAYPNIKSFQPELLKAEAWLVSNPERVPESRWGRFVNNWMRIANQIAEEYKNKTPGAYREPSRRTGGNNKEVLSLGQILNKARGHDLQTTSPPDNGQSIDRSGNADAPGDTRASITSSIAPGATISGRGIFNNNYSLFIKPKIN
jgi:hypothetical protein